MNYHEIDELLAAYDAAVRLVQTCAHDAAGMAADVAAGSANVDAYLRACARTERVAERAQRLRDDVRDAMRYSGQAEQVA